MNKKRLIWFSIFLVLIALIWKLHYFLAVDTCLDGGDVWDYDENSCRQDCLTWTWAKGCIIMDTEYRAVFERCAQLPDECDKTKERKLYLKLCQKYQAPVNLETGLCDFEFTKDRCHKLNGNWQYPDICN